LRARRALGSGRHDYSSDVLTMQSDSRVAGLQLCVLLLLSSCGPDLGSDGVEHVTTEAEFEIAFQIPAAGESEPAFHSITSVALVPGGSEVVVSDDFNRSVRIFERNGTLVQELGRAGEGPGEFGGIPRRVTVVGDEVRVQDRSTRRILRFGLDGAVIGEVASRGEISSWGGDSQLHTPEYLIQGAQMLVTWATGGPRTNLLLSQDGQVAELLHVFPTGTLWWFHSQRPERGNPVIGVNSAGPGGAWAVAGDSLYVFADGYGGIVGWYRLGAGGVERSCQRDLGWEPEPFSVQRSEVVRHVAEQRGMPTADIHDVFVPEFVGRLSTTGLTIAPNGDAWLRLRAANEDERQLEMLVVPCDESRAVRHLRLPRGFLLHDVRDDLLVGVHVDEVTDVRTIRGYRVSW